PATKAAGSTHILPRHVSLYAPRCDEAPLDQAEYRRWSCRSIPARLLPCNKAIRECSIQDHRSTNWGENRTGCVSTRPDFPELVPDQSGTFVLRADDPISHAGQ